MDGAPDAELLGRAKAGDSAAFGLVIERYAPSLYDFAARLTRDRDEAFEVVRETFLVARRGFAVAPAAGELRSWLFAIARANVLAIVEGEKRTGLALTGRNEPPAPLDTLAPGHFDDSEEAMVAEVLAPIAWEAVAGLDARQLALLLLHEREGLSAKETAEAAGVSPENAAVVVTRLERAAEDTAWALLLLRDRTWRCPVLDELLADAPVETLDAATRRIIADHTSECADCALRRAETPSLLGVFAALAPAELAPAELESMKAGLLVEFASADVPPPPRPVAVGLGPRPSPRGVRVLAMFMGLAGIAGVLGALLLVPSSPIALTRNRSTDALPIAASATNPPTVIVITPTPSVTGLAASSGTPRGSATPPRSSSPSSIVSMETPRPGGGGGDAVAATPSGTPTVTTSPSATASDTPSPTGTPSASATPHGTPTSTPTPLPTPCVPTLSTSVRQVDASAGSSSFTIFNSFCRAAQFSLDTNPGSSWLHIQQTFGTLDPGSFVTIGVNADKSTLPEGTTTGGMTLTWVEGSIQIPVVVTRNGGAPIVGPVSATCGPSDQADSFTAHVIDDFGVNTMVLTAKLPDGSTADYPMAIASGDPKAGSYTAAPTGGISSYTVTATDFAGHTGTWNGVCTGG